MLKNYLKLAGRTLIKNRIFSLIIISGLALGYAACIMIYLHVSDELSYDRYNKDHERIYRVVKDFVNDDGSFLPDATTPPALAPGMLSEIAEIEQATRIYPSWGGKYLVRHGDRVFYEEGRLMADTSILKVFTFKFLEGNPETALTKPGNVVITKKMALKYFGNESPIGKNLEIGEGTNKLTTVSAVIDDLPSNSHFHFDLLVPEPTRAKEWNSQWGWYNWYTYIKLKPGASISEVESKIVALFKKNRPDSKTRYYTQPLTDIHLSSKLKWELEANGDIIFVKIFMTVGIFIILIASINYVNLSISQSFGRSKEVGIRKVSGAYGRKLIDQFLTESIVTSLVALLFAIALVEFALPIVNEQFGKSIQPISGQPWEVVVGIVLSGIAIGIISGIYPSLYLAAFKPAQVLKGAFLPTHQNLWLRKGLIVLQFAISIALISGTFIVISQVNYLKSKELGFNKDQVVIIQNVMDLGPSSQRTMKTSLLELPQVEHVGSSNGVLGGQNWTTSMALKGAQSSSLINFTAIDYGYLPVMDIHFVKGRNFSREFPSDTTNSLILNEKAVRDLGITGDPIGALVTDNPDDDTLRYFTVIGVVKDFHFANLRDAIKPYAFYLHENDASNFAVKINTTDIASTMAAMKKTWQSVSPDRPFEYFFLDETFASLYKSEENFKFVFTILAVMAIYIACSGLFAIASFLIRRRTKEIGIRKVLGANVQQITWLVSADFIAIVLLANVLAWPLAYYFMNQWLNGFAYRIELGWASFLIAGAMTLLIAVLTVSTQSIRSAMANPVDSLRNE